MTSDLVAMIVTNCLNRDLLWIVLAALVLSLRLPMRKVVIQMIVHLPHMPDGDFPSLCADRRSHNSVPSYILNRFHWLYVRSSSTTVFFVQVKTFIFSVI